MTNHSERLRKETRIRAIFNQIDRDHNGKLDIDEIQSALKHFGVTLNRERTRDLIKEYDTSGDGTLDVHEFSKLFDRAQLEKIFDHIDKDQSGSIEINELKHLFSEFGVQVGKAQIKQIIHKLDRDNDGTITKTEFFNAFQHIPDLKMENLTSELISLSNLDNGSEIAPSLPAPEENLLRFLFAGGMGGMVSKTITAPLERIKIVAQTQSKVNVPTTQIVKNILREEGWRGLFKGNTAGIIRVVPFSALVCFSYTIMLKVLPSDEKYDKVEPLWRFISGGVAGAFASCSTYPLDVVRARLATQKDLTMKTATQNLLRGGFRSCFYGIRPTLIAIAPFIAVQQSSYDLMKRSLLNYYLPSVPLFLGCGVFAGITAQTITHPFDVIRRQMQTSSVADGNNQPLRKITTADALVDVVKREGFKGLYRGIVPAALKVAPAVAISLLVRDACLDRLDTNSK